MKLLAIFLFTPFMAFADVGACYMMKVNFKTRSGLNESGYVSVCSYDFNIEEQQQSYFYSVRQRRCPLNVKEVNSNGEIYLADSNGEFVAEILSLIPDSLTLNNDIVQIKYKNDSGDRLKIVDNVGELKKFSVLDIIEFNIAYIFAFGSGESIMTAVSSIEKQWVENDSLFKFEYLGEIGICGYQAFIFKNLDKSTVALISEFKELLECNSDYDNNPEKYSHEEISRGYQRVKEMAARLKKKRIIVVESCSC